MSDFIFGRRNYCNGRIEIDSRMFLIEFWEDAEFGFSWYRVSEVRICDVKQHWWSHKTEKREIYDCIDEGWTSGNRLELAKKRISEYLQGEIDRLNERKQIEEFCCAGVATNGRNI